MKKLLLSLITLCSALAVSAQTEVTFDFDNNATALFGIEGRSSGSGATAVNDGDILEAATATVDGVSVTVSPKTSGSNENRLWASSPVLRMYSGTLTVAAEGHKITKIAFTQGKWGTANTFDSGTFANNTWTGEAGSVVLTVAANTQIKKIVVTLDGEGGGEEPTPGINIDELAGTGKGTVESPFDVTRAIALCQAVDEDATSEVYYVEGIVSTLGSYANTFFISQDGKAENELEFYNGKGLQGATLAAGDVAVGDKVVAFGNLVNYKGNTPELTKGCQIYSINGKTEKDPEPAYETVGDGTEANPYTVADIIGMNIETSDGNKYWVKGVILGSATSATKLNETEKDVDTNIALAENAAASTFIPAALPAGDVRSALGVATHPENIGHEVLVYGTLEKYFSVAAVKNVTDYKWVGDAPVVPSTGEEIYSVELNSESIFDGENAWEKQQYVADYDLYQFVDTDDPVAQATSEGYTFYGRINGVVNEYYAMLYSPFFDLTEYTGVYAEWTETCSGFGEDVLEQCTVVSFYAPIDKEKAITIDAEDRAADNGVAKKCRLNVPDEHAGMRNSVYFSFEYASYTAEEYTDEETGETVSYDEWCGKWIVKNFALYGVKKGGDSVERIEPTMPKDVKVYDLSGRELTTLRKGINIVDGKKIVVR